MDTDKLDEMEEIRKYFVDWFKADQQNKIEKYRRLNNFVEHGATLLTGSSLMENFPIYELAQGKIKSKLYNRGIGGFTSDDFIRNIDVVLFDLKPGKIFINIGSNDMSLPDYTLENLCGKYEFILGEINERLPKTQTYVLAFYPMNEKVGHGTHGARTNARISKANEALKKLTKKYKNTQHISANTGLCDSEGFLKAEWTYDGIHMYPEAYAVVFEALLPCLN